MTTLHRGLIVGVVQIALVASVGAKLQMDRAYYPRVWARAAPVDPMLPIRGRYVSLRLEAAAGPGLEPQTPPTVRLPNGTTMPRPAESRQVRLVVDNNGLVAVSAQPGATDATRALIVRRDERVVARLDQPVAYFIPPGVTDPSRRAPGEELWVEVTLPPHGSPRPIRLAVKKNGTLTPLALE